MAFQTKLVFDLDDELAGDWLCMANLRLCQETIQRGLNASLPGLVVPLVIIQRDYALVLHFRVPGNKITQYRFIGVVAININPIKIKFRELTRRFKRFLSMNLDLGISAEARLHLRQNGIHIMLISRDRAAIVPLRVRRRK